MTKALIEGKHKELQTKTIDLLLSENIVKDIMILAGYSKSYANCHWKTWLKNINPEEYQKRLRGKAAVFSDFMINKGFEWANKDDPKWAGVAAKVHGDVTRVHLEDKTPSTVVFQLQTIQGETVNLGEKEPIDGEIIDISQDSQNRDEKE